MCRLVANSNLGIKTRKSFFDSHEETRAVAQTGFYKRLIV